MCVQASATSCRGTTWSTSSSCSCTGTPATWAIAGGSTARRGTSTAELFATGSFPVSTEEAATGHSWAQAFFHVVVFFPPSITATKALKSQIWMNWLIWVFRSFVLRILKCWFRTEEPAVHWIFGWKRLISIINCSKICLFLKIENILKAKKKCGEISASARNVLLGCIFLYIHNCFYTYNTPLASFWVSFTLCSCFRMLQYQLSCSELL